MEAKKISGGQENSLAFRQARREDVPLLLEFIRKLARYERMEDEVTATETVLEEWLFDKGTGEAFFALLEGKEIGFALYFHNFSTFLGRGGLYLEDLFILPEYRGRGYGRRIFQRLAAIAVERGCGRMEWSCLDWNEPSIGFYRAMGARAMDQWTVYRLTGDALKKVSAPPEGQG